MQSSENNFDCINQKSLQISMILVVKYDLSGGKDRVLKDIFTNSKESKRCRKV